MCDNDPAPAPVLAGAIEQFDAVVKPSPDLVPISEVPDLLPRSAEGKKVNISTAYRWRLRGPCDVTLPVTCVAARTFVRRADLLQFLALVHLRRADAAGKVASAAPGSAKTSSAVIEWVKGELEKRGI